MKRFIIVYSQIDNEEGNAIPDVGVYGDMTFKTKEEAMIYFHNIVVDDYQQTANEVKEEIVIDEYDNDTLTIDYIEQGYSTNTTTFRIVEVEF